jgi:hypothetical protein
MLVMLMMSGCASEVDKCVDALVKVYKLDFPKSTQHEIAEEEAQARMHCLKIASGNS